MTHEKNARHRIQELEGDLEVKLSSISSALSFTLGFAYIVTAGHFIFRVMNIHRILNDCAIFIDFDLFCNPSNCKVVTIPVKFNTKERSTYLGQ